MDVIRITELQPKTYVEQGDYIAIDNQSDGTKKVQFTNLLDNTLSQENKIAPANVVGDKIATVRDTMEDEIATIRAAVGSPLKASTVAQMTDTNKIYVYVGSESGYINGNWYYWNGSAWVSGGVYNSVAVVTDPTLTLSGVPADAKATGDELTDLKSAISDIDTTPIQQNNYLDGYYLTRQGNLVADKNYCVSAKIPIVDRNGTYVYGSGFDDNLKINLCEYDELGNCLDYWGPANGAILRHITNFNANTKYIRFSYVKGYADACFRSAIGGTFTAIYWKPYDIGGEITSKTIGDRPKEFSATALSTDGFRVCHNSLKSPRIYAYAKISAFAGIYIGHGESGTYTQYFKIDNTNVTFYTHGTEGSSIAHGLTIDTYIGVTIDVNYDCSYKITIHTLGGSWSREMAHPNVWQGNKGDTFIKAVSGTTATYVALGYVGKYQFTKWMFGDSYLSNYSDARWAYYLTENNAEYTMINAFAGENSKEAYLDWIDALNNGTPKYAIWCLGMNDPDNEAVNSDWLTIVQAFIADCQHRGITPILATIPNVPTIDHTYKNAWVKASGYRYIDFAEAVGAESAGSTWYTGCLETSTPRVHPTTDGARLLYMRAITDFPEFLQE